MDVVALSKSIETWLKRHVSEAERIGDFTADGCAWVFGMEQPEVSGLLRFEPASDSRPAATVGIGIYFMPGDELDREDLVDLLLLNAQMHDAAMIAVPRDDDGAFDVLLHRSVPAEAFKPEDIGRHVTELSAILDGVVADHECDDEECGGGDDHGRH